MNKPTRIRYKLSPDGVHTSTAKYLGNDGTLLFTQVNVAAKEVLVLMDGDPVKVVEKAAMKDFSEGKKIAKKLLKKYGVNILDEVRKKKAVVAVTQE